MKLIYLTPTLSSPAGMERVLHNKVCWLKKNRRVSITIVTTEQGNAPVYYDFPEDVTIVDLGINYSVDYNLNPLARMLALNKKRKLHKKKLSTLLEKEKADVCIALCPSEMSVVPGIRDGSKKVMEFHSNRFFRMNQGYHGIHALIARYRTWADKRLAKKFDKCVVLTHEGAEQWGRMPNLEVIPNAVTHVPDVTPSVESHRVIAAGRLIHEKGFDRLLRAWSLLPEKIRSEWRLDIFGQGEREASLKSLIRELGIDSSVAICPPTTKIFEEYAKSAFIVTCSRSEGFGMVMLEAMACGIPVVSFDYYCGPREIVRDGTDGILVQEGNIEKLAQAIQSLIQNPHLRKKLASRSKDVLDRFSEDRIMHRWEKLFEELTA